MCAHVHRESVQSHTCTTDAAAWLRGCVHTRMRDLCMRAHVHAFIRMRANVHVSNYFHKHLNRFLIDYSNPRFGSNSKQPTFNQTFNLTFRFYGSTQTSPHRLTAMNSTLFYSSHRR